MSNVYLQYYSHTCIQIHTNFLNMFLFYSNFLFITVVKSVEGEKLILTNVHRTDMGGYLCIASNGVPPSVSKRFDVHINCKYKQQKLQAKSNVITFVFVVSEMHLSVFKYILNVHILCYFCG